MEALYGLNEVDTLSVTELAERLGKSAGSIGKIRSRTIAKLRLELEITS